MVRAKKKIASQSDIFDEAELEMDAADLLEQAQETEEPAKKKKACKKLSDKLPRIQVYIDLTDEEKEGAIDTCYTKVKEELDIVPAQVRVLEYLQEKAVFEKDGERQIKAAQRPVHPLGKTIASVRLLAYIIIAQYCDSLP